jgi:hypothetical protein
VVGSVRVIEAAAADLGGRDAAVHFFAGTTHVGGLGPAEAADHVHGLFLIVLEHLEQVLCAQLMVTIAASTKRVA